MKENSIVSRIMKSLGALESRLLKWSLTELGWFTVIGAGLAALIYFRIVATEHICRQANKIMNKAKGVDATLKAKEDQLSQEADQITERAKARKAPPVADDWYKH